MGKQRMVETGHGTGDNKPSNEIYVNRVQWRLVVGPFMCFPIIYLMTLSLSQVIWLNVQTVSKECM